jgi:hypothetical protein
MYIISADEFILNTALNAISGFSKIGKGITLVNSTVGSTLGVTSSGDQRFWGTASNSDKLGGIAASEYLRASTTSFATPIHFSDSGFTVGNSNNLSVSIIGSTPTIANVLGNTVNFQTTVAGQTKTPLTLVGADILPGDTNSTSLGSAAKVFSTVYATSFNGIVTQSNQILETVSGLYRSGNTGAAASTVAVRDSNADIYANVFQGIASSADYADLAEKYLADADYLVGTVVAIGGEKEVTACTVGDRAIGVISANPAYMMNSGLEGGTYVALKGRVPCKVVGPIMKGQRLIAGSNGAAQVAHTSTDVFAIALESNDDIAEKTIEVLVL